MELYDKAMEFLKLLDKNNQSVYIEVLLSVLGIIGLVIKDKVKDFFSKKLETLSAYLYFRVKQLPEYKKCICNNYQIIKTPFILESLELNMEELYIQRSIVVNGEKRVSERDIYNTLNDYRRILITGPPGIGKSLLCKKILLNYANNIKSNGKLIPVLIELHQINNSDKIDFIELIARNISPRNINQLKIIIEKKMTQGGLLLLLDGLDEINDKWRRNVVDNIVEFLKPYYECKVIVTCRSLVYKNEFTNYWNLTRAEISNFSYRDITSFLKKIPPELVMENKSPEIFFENLKEQHQKVQELFKNPLLLTIAVYLYLFKDELKVFPHSRSFFYEETIDILLSGRLGANKIDMQFKTKDKKYILQKSAYFMQANNKTTISYNDIYNITLPIVRNEEQVDLILNEIKDKSGLICFASRSRDEYQFFHATFRDFFVAQKIASEGNDKELVSKFHENPDGWREPIKFWCGLVENSSSVICEILPLDLITTLECLTDIKNIDQAILKEIIINSQKKLRENDDDVKIVCKILGTIASVLSSKQGIAVFNMLKKTIYKSTTHCEIKASANALSFTYNKKSAQLLSKYIYKSGVTDALIQMGNVAVEGIEELAIQGDVKAMENLWLINSKNSNNKKWLKALAKASLQLIQKVTKEDCVYHAAWHLASLLPNHDLQSTFQEYDIGNIEKREGMRGVWEPFKKEKMSNFKIIAERIAYLVFNTPYGKIPHQKRILDPRLAVPVYLELLNKDDEQSKEQADHILSVMPRAVRDNVEGKISTSVCKHWGMIYTSNNYLIQQFTLSFLFKVFFFTTVITYISANFLNASSIRSIFIIVLFEIISMYLFFRRESSVALIVLILCVIFSLATELINLKNIPPDMVTIFFIVGKKIASILIWLVVSFLVNYIFTRILKPEIEPSPLYGILGRNQKETQEKFLTSVGQPAK